MKAYRKRDYPLERIRRFLEPGPIVLVSSAWEGKRNIMTMGWHMMLGFSPALFGCYIWDGNRSFEMLRRIKECVINLPTTVLVGAVVGIGNCSGKAIDKSYSGLDQDRRELRARFATTSPQHFPAHIACESFGRSYFRDRHDKNYHQ